jgi:hypothetical protein
MLSAVSQARPAPALWVGELLMLGFLVMLNAFDFWVA